MCHEVTTHEETQTQRNPRMRPVFLLLTLHGFSYAMRFTTVGHEIHELDFLEGSVSAIRRGRKARRPAAAQTPWPFS